MAGTTKIIEVTDATFESDVLLQSQEKPVIVDFWAPWCGPCRVLGPILERIAGDRALDFVLAKVNVDDNPNLAMRYRVQGIPVVKAFVDGQVVDEFVGALPESRVRQFIEKLIPNEADLALRAANSLLATRHWAEAEDAFRDLLEEYPHHPQATLNLAKALLAQAQGCEAGELLQEVRHGALMLAAERLLPLARYLCRTSMQADEEELGSPIDAQYRRAAHLMQKGNLEAAMDGLLDVVRQDKRYRDGEPKNVLLAIFELLGESDPLTQTYRSELAMLLF